LVRLIARIARHPGCSFLLRGDPAELSGRRPGSTPEFYEMSLRRFERLSRICPELIAISPGDLERTQRQIRDHLEPLLANRARVRRAPADGFTTPSPAS